jgi:hypothetical protein
MKLISTILFLYYTIMHANALIEDCSNGNSYFQITKLAVTPDPPIIGKDVDLTLIFYNPGDVIDTTSDITVETHVTLNSIPFTPSYQALCDNTKCPIVYGENDRSTRSVWPDVSGKMETHITWTKSSGEQLLCVRTLFKINSVSTMLRGNYAQNKTVYYVGTS